MKKLILLLMTVACFGIAQAQTAIQARWFNKQTGNVYSSLSYTTTDDSLLTYNVRIQGFDTNYYAVVWITNNTANDFAAGDSLKLVSRMNGHQVLTWTLTLRNGLQKDSTTYFILNEYILVKGYSQWGANNYTYSVTAHNTTPVTDAGNANMSFVFNRKSTTVSIAQVRWYNKQTNLLYQNQSFSSSDDSLLIKYRGTIQDLLDTNYTAIIWIQNNSANDLAAGDSIKITTYINGHETYTRKLTLSKALQKDSTLYFTVNETILLPNMCQWGANIYTYKVVKYNETPVTDVSSTNTVTFTFNKITPLTGITVTNAGWFNSTNNTISKTLSIQSDNDSLLNKYTYKIQNLSQDYYTGVQVTNNSGSDLVAGDSIKVLLKINGTNIYVSKITLTKSIQKDSSTYCLLNDYVIVPNISHWGENTYCYQVVYYNENPVNDNPTNNCMTFTFNKTTGIVENALEEVKIYPNPARNILHINNVENANIDIYSITGQRVKTIKNVTGNQDIDVSDMANGMYILRMQDGQNTRVEKIQVIK